MNEVYSGMFFYSQRTAKITVHNFFCIILKLHFHSNKAKVIWHIWQHRLAVDNIFCRITSCHRPAVILDLIEAEIAQFDPLTLKILPQKLPEPNMKWIGSPAAEIFFFFFFFAFQLLQKHRPPTILRSCALLSASLQLSFMLPSSFSTVFFHVLWFSSVSTTLRGPSQSFFRYTVASFPHCVPNLSPLHTSNRCLHGILLSHVPQFFIGYLVFPVEVEDSS